ncbi:thiamine pyrophosphate-dependent dehydrogenase E1 component subunit alpha [Roseibium marinum]|uniref:Pyruvate dehydrogenase E1 component alpha subunit n=1 Tax=Roseibium marinum TaxID=281252 RepID=A0A2S3V307_9HYPH|nr:thiamine pyrophosphate-dependent dehydrogenase E1 component subunit alpha [Roseibium marinum]POF34351.1 pyruvate dehydrogenase E1 component alpha subunit [Roseibium marinum]
MTDLIELLRGMKRIRAVEQGIADRYMVQPQQMRCPTHLSIGQELVGALAGLALKPSDYAVSSHRGHAHYIGKGGDIGRMLAEIYGKVTGCSRGRGGSMHLIDESVGFMGTTAIVGNSIPVGVGLGLAAKLDGKEQVSAIFLGDGATEEGSFYESATIAAVRKLPVIFICENNLYSVYSPLNVRQPKNRVIHEMVAAYGGLDTYFVEGDDPEATTDELQKAVDKVRSGAGPAFIEITTYRWREHCGPNWDNHLPYRDEDEFENWKERDPLPELERRLLERGTISAERIASINQDVEHEVEAAFKFANESPFPDESEAYIDEYMA